MRRLLVLLPVLALLLTGCALSQEPEQDEEEIPWLVEDPAEEEPPAPVVTLPERFALPYHRDQTLDPVTCGADVQFNVAALLYETLVVLDETFEPQPNICTGWVHNEDFTVWTLGLREGVLFSDGTLLTAEDAALALRRAAGSARYGYRLRQLANAQAADGSVVVTLTASNSGFPALLDIPVVKAGTENWTVPTGTGPYRWSGGEEGDSLVPNENWWQGGGQPLDRIELVHAKDRETALALFASRQVQLCSLDLTGQKSISLTGSILCTDAPGTTLQYVGINCLTPILEDPLVRRTLREGLQRDQVAQGLLSGHAQAAQFPISPQSDLYPAQLEHTYRYDTFMEDMSAAGLDTGEPLTLTMLVNEENPFKVWAAQYVAKSLSVCDLTVEVSVLPWEAFTAALAAGDFDLYYGEVKLTADWDVTSLLHTNGELNYGGYSSWYMDDLLADLSVSKDRAATAQGICRWIGEQAPILPVCFKSYSVLTHEGVAEGLAPSAANVFQDMTGWTVHLQEP